VLTLHDRLDDLDHYHRALAARMTDAEDGN
jgi:hypothetical protein